MMYYSLIARVLLLAIMVRQIITELMVFRRYHNFERLNVFELLEGDGYWSGEICTHIWSISRVTD